MRIVGGRLRGLKLGEVPGAGVRPTSDRVRESLFNILAHDADLRTEAGPFPAGVPVLDVFAGTGALGLEALSRGATNVSFIENAPDSLKLLRANIEKARAADQVRVLQRDALAPGRAKEPAGLVLMDPPYHARLAGPAILALEVMGWLSPEVLIVVETDAREALEVPEGFTLDDERRYGRTKLRTLSRS